MIIENSFVHEVTKRLSPKKKFQSNIPKNPVLNGNESLELIAPVWALNAKIPNAIINTSKNPNSPEL
ncbi:hypothetical protein [Mycoplasmopsis synoviae]|uniref:hypothetical protein n=1 Tax=Mycoplasmopsis synoviae TaxID=2109 RepID=UPI001CE05C7D|nr:hypothetical protein [Mycoplasmopsis synoviae]